MTDTLFSLISLSMILLAAYWLGRPVVDGLGVMGRDRLGRVVWGVTVGLILAGQLLAVCGLVGLLDPTAIRVATWVVGLWVVWRLAGGGRVRSRDAGADGLAAAGPQAVWEANPAGGPPRWLARSVLGLAALAALSSLVAALAPPTAGDALCYHLELPKRFLAESRIRHLPDHDNATYPLLVEMWYVWGLAMDGPVAAQLLHWASGLLWAAATVLLASPLVGRRWGWIGGGLIPLIPGVSNQMGAPLNDVATALMATLAIGAWWRGTAGGESRRWFVLAGLATGGALAAKYVALVLVAAAGLALAWSFLRHREHRGVLASGVMIVGVVAASVAGLWYVRALWHRGNPVYPLLTEVFPAGGLGGERGTLPASKSPLGRGPVGLVTAPWHVTMRPEAFGGRGHQVGPLWLAALPGLLWTRRLRGLDVLLAMAACYGVLWFLLRQNVRFLFPVVSVLALAVVWVWMEMRRLPAGPRVVAAAAFALVLVVSAAAAVRRGARCLAVAGGLETRAHYLARSEPSWPAAAVSNALFGREGHLLSQDYRAFYFQCRVTREHLYRRRTGYDRQVTQPGQLSRCLRAAGFTHLLLAENLNGRGITYDPTLRRLVEAQEAADGGRSLETIAEYRFSDADGGLRRYRLIRLR